MDKFIKIEFEKEECELLYNQLSVRVMDFESMMVQAANKKDFNRVLEIAEIIKILKSAMNKLLIGV